MQMSMLIMVMAIVFGAAFAAGDENDGALLGCWLGQLSEVVCLCKKIYSALCHGSCSSINIVRIGHNFLCLNN